ncbi:MAG: phenylalanine--tRNA ligase subunit beta [Spirochaetes bacterium]|nr:phenylalanine--tRNA ligase subunit beta [Spirochaetota bacterium]
MRLSLNILSEIVDISGISPEDIAHRLTMSTAEIDGIEYMNGHLNSVITAKVENVLRHPNADKLTLVDLSAGDKKYRVVCGAPNHKTGDIVALATPGTKLSEEFTVQKARIRGESSDGMLCSEKELGISDDHSGIMILPSGTQTGVPLSKIMPQRTDVVLDIDNKALTHRPDLWSHVGFSREVAALFNRKSKNPVNFEIGKTFKNADKLSVIIENPEASSRYCGLIVKNISVAESPDWLKAKVISIGMRPINNIVDITNYVMAELGEPMHAFDRKKLTGNDIIVKMAKDGGEIKTLDGNIRKLTADDIVIADSGGSIALAGVMGGADSEIDADTTEIVLEAANFNSVNIRKTAARHGLRTEAAVRFEKSLDPELCGAAIIRCYDLIKQIIPAAEAASAIIDNYPVKRPKITIKTDTDFIRRRIGNAVPDDKILSILKGLEFKVTVRDKNLEIEVPTYRATGDIDIPEDIVEEVGRIYGYDSITPLPALVPCATPRLNEKRLFERRIKDILSRDHHLTEVSNYSFVNETVLNRLKINENRELRLRNPLSSEQDRLRRSLIPNLVMNIELNQRYHDAFRIFEFGRVYLKEDRKSKELAAENNYVTGAVYQRKAKAPLFYDAKNVATDLLEQLRIKNVKYAAASEGMPPYAHPGKSLEIIVDNKKAGLIFELHPKTIEDFELKGTAALFDINADILFASAKTVISFSELQKFPDVPFEISVLSGRQVYSAGILSIIEKTNSDHIKSTEVISIYEGKPVPEDMKSVSIRIIFAAKDKTLSPQDIDGLQKKVIDSLAKAGYNLR